MGISVVICCYNSSARLPDTLRHIAAQQLSKSVEWEVLLVDNGSADNTISVAYKCWKDYGSPAPMRVISELRQGLSFAREAGIKNAAHDVIVFCDDDNWLAPDYLQVGSVIMESDIQIGVCGGVGEAVFEGEKPSWFERYKAVFACHEQAENEGYLGMDVLALYGAGLFIRRRAMLEFYKSGYDFSLTDRAGNQLTGGHDYEMVMLYRLLNFKLYYTPRLRFKHYMPQSRMQWKYLIKLVYGSAVSSAPLFIYADLLRYKLTGNKKYKVSWGKDILKAINSARLVPVDELKDLQIVWARLSGGIRSVLSNIPNYRRLESKLTHIYESAHKTH